MDNQEVNEIIYRAMFGIIEEDQIRTYATEWEDYGEVLEWAKRQDWWVNFINKLYKEYHGGSYNGLSLVIDIMDDIINTQTGSRALAEFIKSEGIDG